MRRRTSEATFAAAPPLSHPLVLYSATPVLDRHILEPPMANPAPPRRPPDAAPSPPLRPPRHNLPAALSSFIGRERELAAVRDLLAAHRLVTLTGSGGAGKTRLALAIASGLVAEHPHGVWLAELAPLVDPALVPGAVAAAVGVREEPGTPLPATLARALGDLPVLVVLDNCEHLIDACAQLAAALLRVCPGLRLLATSREPLGVPGEASYRVPSLALPDPAAPPEAIAAAEAVRLFAERARAVRSDFALTPATAVAAAALCVRLDGIPLALELAAARLRALPLDELVRRLDDRFRLLTGGDRTALPRQQTLAAAIDWSYQLLDRDERLLLRRLAVFAGGWTLDAAEAVCAGDGLDTWHILDLLARLVDKSLVLPEERGEGARYRLLETVRQFAAERLADAGEAEAARDRHAAHYLGVAERAAAELRGPAQATLALRLDQEHDNLRAALAWTLSRGDGATALRLAGALWYYWYLRGYVGEGRRWLERALPAGADAPLAARALALNGLGAFVSLQDSVAQGRLVLAESLALWRNLADAGQCARLLNNLALMAFNQGDLARSRAEYEEALTLARGLGDAGHSLVAFTLVNLSQTVTLAGDHAYASALAEEGLALARATGYTMMAGVALLNLGRIAVGRRDPRRAGALLLEGLALFRDLGFQEKIAEALGGLAAAARAAGQRERAARLAGAAEAVRGVIGARLLSGHLSYDRDLHIARAGVDEAVWAREFAEGRSLSLDEAVACASASIVTEGDAQPGRAAPPALPLGLTAREVEVLRLVAQGLNDGEVAERLFLSRFTVKAHLRSVYNKTGVSSRAAATRLAAEHGLL
jgi:non-specific serine/threonine protein kinase